jgi:hypothetical protein
MSPKLSQPSAALCNFCRRPLAGFEYANPSSANEGYCSRKDCTLRRREIAKEKAGVDLKTRFDKSVRLRHGVEIPTGHTMDPATLVAVASESESDLEDGDAATESRNSQTRVTEEGLVRQETPRVEGDGVVPTTSEILNDAPKIVQVRAELNLPIVKPDIQLAGELRGKPILARRNCETHGVDGCRDCFPPIDHAAKERKRHEDHEKLLDQIRAEIERAKPVFEPIVETMPLADAIRNQWELEKHEEDLEIRRQGQLLIREVKASHVEKSGEENLRLALKLTTRDLARFIKNGKFCRPFEIKKSTKPREIYIDHWKDIRGGTQKPEKPMTKIVRVPGPDGVLREHICTVLPMKKRVLRRAGSKVPTVSEPRSKKVTALSERESSFYRDYASNNLSVDRMVEKHGAWTDDEIRDLENRIIRHATKVRLVEVLPDNSTDEYTRGLDEARAAAETSVDKSGGGSIGASGVHRGKLGKYGDQRGLDDFRTPLPKMDGSGWSPLSRDGAPEADNYGEESFS